MAIHSKTRDLARRLLDFEAQEADSSRTSQSTTLRAYEKLRLNLGAFAGMVAFTALASRALAVARKEASGLEALQISEDGSLRGLAELDPPVDMNKSQAADNQVEDRGVILIAQLLEMLLIFLGEALTLSLLRVSWPSTIFDDRNSGNGRKA